jgi:EthD domain
MSTQICKVLIFLKRRPGMSQEAFRDYYENVHSKLGEKYSAGVRRYVRRYVQPLPRESGINDEMDFDVITELWFDDRALCDKVAEFASRGQLPADVLADEERVFDRSKTRYATVVELESKL